MDICEGTGYIVNGAPVVSYTCNTPCVPAACGTELDNVKNLVATPTANVAGSIWLKWGRVTGATSYTIQYGQSSSFRTNTRTITSSTTRKIITGLLSNGSYTYYFRVKAKRGTTYQSSLWSSVASAQPNKQCPRQSCDIGSTPVSYTHLTLPTNREV